MANLSSSPVVLTKLFELSSYCPGGSKYLGSVDISLASDRFLGVARRVDCWTPPTLSVLDLGEFKKPISVSTIPIDLNDPASERTAQFEVNENGQLAIFYDTSNIWIQDLQKSNPAVHRLPKLDYFSAIRLVKWSREDTLVVITADSTVYNIEFDYDSDFKNVSCKFPELQQSDLSFETKRITGYFTAGEYSGSSNIRVENGRTVGTLYLNNEENHFDINGCPINSFSISGFTGAFARVVDSVPGKEVTLFVYADAGSDFFSLKISAVLCSEKKIWSESFKSPKWKLELLHPRSHDTKSPDLPIALHISVENAIIFLVTKLSYVHLFQLATGSHLGSIRVSSFRISASALCSNKMDLLLVDANGTIFRLDLDIQGWISRLNISSKNNMDRLPALRLVIQNDIPITKELFFEFFPKFSHNNGQAYENAVKLIEPLSGDELLKLFTSITKSNPSMLHIIRMLAQKCSDKIQISDLVSLFKTYGGATGVFAFLNCTGLGNLKGHILAEYIESAIETQHYDVLETFLLTGKVADPNAALQVLKRRASSDPKITAWIEKFCDRFDFVEDLVAAYLKEGFSQLAFIKKLIEKSDASKAMRIFKALLESKIPDAILDAFLTVVKPLALTPDFLKILGQHQRLNNGIRCLEILVARPKSEARLVLLLRATYDQDKETSEANLITFFKKIGKTRCEEIGQMIEKIDYQLAALIYKSGQCDVDYIRLAFNNRLYPEVTVYLLRRASIDLWSGVLSGPFQNAIFEAFHVDEFQAELIKSPFPATKVLLTALQKERFHANALFVLDCLNKTPFQDKNERSFIQESTIAIRATFYPEEVTNITTLVTNFKDFDHVKVLTHLLLRKMIVPAKIIISRLLQKEIEEEATLEDIVALESAASSTDEKSVWVVIGNFYLERHELYEALVAYISGQHHSNYTDVLKAIKSAKSFGKWEAAVAYLQMVERSVKDAKVNTALSIALVKSNRYDELEKLLESSVETTGSKGEQNCVVCVDAPKQINFLPCNHVCACVQCAERETICPICRAPITSKHRIYLS